MSVIIDGMINSYSSVWWGLLVAVITAGLCFAAIFAVMGGRREFTPFSWMLGVVMTTFFTYEYTYLIGAMSLKADYNHAVEVVDQLIPNKFLQSQADNVREAIDGITAEIPLVSTIVDSVAVADAMREGFTAENLLSDGRSYIDSYIMKRAVWLLVGGAVCTTLLILTMSKGNGQSVSRRRVGISTGRRRDSAGRRHTSRRR